MCRYLFTYEGVSGERLAEHHGVYERGPAVLIRLVHLHVGVEKECWTGHTSVSTDIYLYLALVSLTPPCNPLISSEFKYPRIARNENPATMPSSSWWKRRNEQTKLRTIHAFASSWFRNIVISMCPRPVPKHSQLSGWHEQLHPTD